VNQLLEGCFWSGQYILERLQVIVFSGVGVIIFAHICNCRRADPRVGSNAPPFNCQSIRRMDGTT